MLVGAALPHHARPTFVPRSIVPNASPARPTLGHSALPTVYRPALYRLGRVPRSSCPWSFCASHGLSSPRSVLPHASLAHSVFSCPTLDRTSHALPLRALSSRDSPPPRCQILLLHVDATRRFLFHASGPTFFSTSLTPGPSSPMTHSSTFSRMHSSSSSTTPVPRFSSFLLVGDTAKSWLLIHKERSRPLLVDEAGSRILLSPTTKGVNSSTTNGEKI